MFERIKQHNKILAILFSLIGITLIFFGGMFSSNTRLEKIAEYATSVVLNQTSGKHLCALTVGKTEDSGQILDAKTEFTNTYGTFMQQRIAFASAVNPGKDLSINFTNIQTDNLSILYGDAIGTIEYDDHFKHNTLPIELMFPDERMYDIADNFVVYVSQNHADSILDFYNVPRQEDGFHTTNEYKSLLKQLISISINGVVTNFAIQNIYYQFNYYYDSLYEVMGDFVISSYYLPGTLLNERRNMYFMDEYVYHNKYFMNYINSAYPSHNYSLKINRYNIEGQIDEEYFLSFYYSLQTNNYDWINTLLVLISVLLLFSSLFLVFFVNYNSKQTIISSVLHLSALFIPYLVFSTIYRFTGNIIFLSEKASKTNVFIILIYSFIYIMLLLYEKRFFQKKRIYEKDCYEVDI